MSEPQAELAVGATLHVALGAPASYDAIGFAELAYTEIVDIVNIGEAGGSANVPTYTPLKTGTVVKRVGSINYGDQGVQMGRHMTEAGHQLLKAGFDGANRGKVHSVKVLYADGGIEYYVAVISSFTSAQKEADGYRFANITLNLTDKIVEVAPSATAFTIAYTPGANGTIIGSLIQVVESGEDGSEVFASAADGYEFSSWSDSSTDNPRQDTNVTADLAVTANFTAL